MSSENHQSVVEALDAIHRSAQAAYIRRDSRAYMDVFSADLTYRRADGKTIGRDELAENVRSQLSMLDSADTSFIREKLEVVGPEATEFLRQVATVKTRHFVVIRRTWNIERVGKYVWQNTDQGWRIQEVEVLKETVTPAGTRLTWT